MSDEERLARRAGTPPTDATIARLARRDGPVLFWPWSRWRGLPEVAPAHGCVPALVGQVGGWALAVELGDPDWWTEQVTPADCQRPLFMDLTPGGMWRTADGTGGMPRSRLPALAAPCAQCHGAGTDGHCTGHGLPPMACGDCTLTRHCPGCRGRGVVAAGTDAKLDVDLTRAGGLPRAFHHRLYGTREA